MQWGEGGPSDSSSSSREDDFSRTSKLQTDIEGREFGYLDLSAEGSSEVAAGKVRWGAETVFVNASVMNFWYRPVNRPWVVDLDLPLG